jgi:hypothetical protein
MALSLNIASLNLVKAEVDATLTQVEGFLGSFVEERENIHPLAHCVEGLEQVHGAIRLIELPGAEELAEGMAELMRQVQQKGSEAPDEAFGALGGAIMVLSRYLEYVQIKGVGWPQLLLPTINQVQAALGRPPVHEGHFLALGEIPAAPPTVALQITPEHVQPLLRRIRLMYQTGLIAVLRDQADVPHFRLMARAMERAQQLSGGQVVAVQWWVAAAMIEALQGGVAINLLRKNLLGQLDRQLKRLFAEGKAQGLDSRILADTLYVVGLAESGAHVDAVKTAFALSEHCLTEAALTHEYELMCGPGGSVIKTVASVLRDELAQVKDSLDLISRGAHVGTEGFQTVADNLTKTSQTLVMLGLLDISRQVREQADHVRAWRGEPDNAELHTLVDVLMETENAVAGLVKQVTPGVETQVNNSRISIHQLDEARVLLIAESRSGLSLAKRAISSYLESDRDLMHLANVPTTLQSVSGGLSFLLIVRGAAVLQAAAEYIDKRMLSAPQQPPMADLENLADAISSVDYYLESLESNKPIGDSILDIAEESLAELGFPVRKQQAA